MNVGTILLGPFPENNTIIIADLFDGVGLSSCPGFTTLDIVAGNEEAVTDDNLTGLEKGDITDKEILDVDDAFGAGPESLDATPHLILVEDVELPFTLPAVEGADNNL